MLAEKALSVNGSDVVILGAVREVLPDKSLIDINTAYVR